MAAVPVLLYLYLVEVAGILDRSPDLDRNQVGYCRSHSRLERTYRSRRRRRPGLAGSFEVDIVVLGQGQDVAPPGRRKGAAAEEEDLDCMPS